MESWNKIGGYGGMTEVSESEIVQLVESILDDYHWEYVAPLEKRIEELGGKRSETSANESGSFRPDRSHGYWIDQKWEQFFRILYKELCSSGFLTHPNKTEAKTKNEKNQPVVAFLAYFDGVSRLTESHRPKWQNNKRGDLELCVYFIDKLIRLNIITDHKKDKLIEEIFGIKDPTRKRQKFATYSTSDFKPKRYKEIDVIIETSIDKMS